MSLSAGLVRDVPVVGSQTLSAARTVTFTVQDEKGPSVFSQSPAHASQKVVPSDSDVIHIVFSENIVIVDPTEVVVFTPIRGSTSVSINAFQLTLNSPQVAVSGNTMSITHGQNLGTDGKFWTVSMGGAGLGDASSNQNMFAGLAAGSSSNPGEYWFQVNDTVPPTALSYSPLNGAIAVDGSQNITIVFDEYIEVGQGILNQNRANIDTN